MTGRGRAHTPLPVGAGFRSHNSSFRESPEAVLAEVADRAGDALYRCAASPSRRPRRPSRRQLCRAVGRVIDAALEPLEARQLLSSSLSGTIWNDANGNGSRDPGEAPLAGWTVYLDQNRSRT